jgi:DNA-binding response OmpR family regulator
LRKPAEVVGNDMKGEYILNNNSLALIIEDDEAHANLFSEALQIAGFEVEIIRDGKTALSRLSHAAPTVVVLDINLPYVSGVDILHYIRSDERLVKTRVIIASANERIAATLQDEADLVLIKPISYFQLRDLSARLRIDKPFI